MKNIHILPTDKPSRLFIAEKDVDMFILSDKYELGNPLCENQILYITNDEVIKEGDWCLFGENTITRYYSEYSKNMYKKIILTTDPDLIKDGVQDIDDKFLEWFVKNPSCENVKIEQIKEHINCTSGKEPCQLVCDNCSYYEIVIPKEEPNQETLEEAAETYSKVTLNKQGLMSDKQVNGFIAGAKWQQRKSYTEEDMKQFARSYFREIKLDMSNTAWDDLADRCFEQFKKK